MGTDFRDQGAHRFIRCRPMPRARQQIKEKFDKNSETDGAVYDNCRIQVPLGRGDDRPVRSDDGPALFQPLRQLFLPAGFPYGQVGEKDPGFKILRPDDAVRGGGKVADDGPVWLRRGGGEDRPATQAAGRFSQRCRPGIRPVPDHPVSPF